jgi:hypothetical protein
MKGGRTEQGLVHEFRSKNCFAESRKRREVPSQSRRGPALTTWIKRALVFHVWFPTIPCALTQKTRAYLRGSELRDGIHLAVSPFSSQKVLDCDPNRSHQRERARGCVVSSARCGDGLPSSSPAPHFDFAQGLAP